MIAVGFDWFRSVIWPFIFNYRLFFDIVLFKTLKSFFSGNWYQSGVTRSGAGLWVRFIHHQVNFDELVNIINNNIFYSLTIILIHHIGDSSSEPGTSIYSSSGSLRDSTICSIITSFFVVSGIKSLLSTISLVLSVWPCMLWDYGKYLINYDFYA